MFHLVLESHDGRAPGADSEEKHEPVSDIDTVVVDSLKVLDPDGRLEKRPKIDPSVAATHQTPKKAGRTSMHRRRAD